MTGLPVPTAAALAPLQAKDKHPSEYFIRYLICLPRDDAAEDGWVRANVEQYGFPPPAAGFLSDLRDHLEKEKPADYDPHNSYHPSTRKYLRKIGIWSMCQMDDDVKNAIEILNNRDVRAVVEQLLLGRVGATEVATKTNSRFCTFFTKGAVKAYAHYFWNVSLLKVEEWASFYQSYDAGTRDKAVSVLRAGPEMAIYKTGFKVHKEVGDVLREFKDDLYYDFQEWKMAPPSEDRTKAMTSIFKTIMQYDAKLKENEAAGMQDKLKDFQQFRMASAESSVKGIDELAPHGNFTDSGEDVKELPPGEDEE